MSNFHVIGLSTWGSALCSLCVLQSKISDVCWQMQSIAAFQSLHVKLFSSVGLYMLRKGYTTLESFTNVMRSTISVSTSYQWDCCTVAAISLCLNCSAFCRAPWTRSKCCMLGMWWSFRVCQSTTDQKWNKYYCRTRVWWSTLNNRTVDGLPLEPWGKNVV